MKKDYSKPERHKIGEVESLTRQLATHPTSLDADYDEDTPFDKLGWNESA